MFAYAVSRYLLSACMALVPIHQVSASQQSTFSTDATPLLKFAVVSIHQHHGSDGWKYDYSADGFTANAIPLEELFKEAFGVFDDHLIEAMPSWAKVERYDIIAKVDTEDIGALKGLTLEQRRSMLREMLANRFYLVIHHEMKETSVYALTVSKKGATLKQSITPVAPGTMPGFGGTVKRSQSGVLEVERFDMKGLAQSLTWTVGRPIVDETGLTGRYDLALHWTPQAQNVPNSESIDDAAGPSLFTALREQLGLKLVAAKRAVDIVVIDAFERPDQN